MTPPAPRHVSRPAPAAGRGSGSAGRRAAGGRAARSKPNPLDRDRITYIDYKDTDLLRKFLSDRGKIRSRRVTRVSAQQQRMLARAIKNAREMALLPYGSAPR
ncbi:30S ribosomal protein S18 [Streptomyces sp. LP05-1]|uniref:Small ribosomal subunit protein bS18 n=1 Tax=Streptomyces pyxinae TaxID=2970734 RepID=A0ABT2CNI8_9ACTN|nr:30S ribosomal protein S18 [Streptomyces sp. LP05-1]MCS0639010.1 30S ribosomal protein S18 [Streptomyces sp. LP05-1]